MFQNVTFCHPLFITICSFAQYHFEVSSHTFSTQPHLLSVWDQIFCFPSWHFWGVSCLEVFWFRAAQETQGKDRAQLAVLYQLGKKPPTNRNHTNKKKKRKKQTHKKTQPNKTQTSNHRNNKNNLPQKKPNKTKPQGFLEFPL